MCLVGTCLYFTVQHSVVSSGHQLGHHPHRINVKSATSHSSVQASGVYIPVSPLLLEMLHWSELKRTPTGGAGAAPDMLLLLRLSKTQLKMASLQEEVVNQVSIGAWFLFGLYPL